MEEKLLFYKSVFLPFSLVLWDPQPLLSPSLSDSGRIVLSLTGRTGQLGQEDSVQSDETHYQKILLRHRGWQLQQLETSQEMQIKIQAES